MKPYKRIFTIVIDSMGIGAAPDADKFDDLGSDTLGGIQHTDETGGAGFRWGMGSEGRCI